MIPKGLQNYGANLGGFMNGINLLGGKVSNKGTGAADQQASLSGSVAVSVVEVMPNGNLVLRGEKQLALTEGSEVIQVAGIIRPDDVAPNNTVQSRRLANAQIAYRGTGDLANATKAGWGTSALLKIWPF
jgi:flagellar L-ring protein precursor FlgH